MKYNDVYFRIYACCVLVKGAKRSIICDLQRAKYVFIPNDLYENFKILKDTPLGLVLDQLEGESKKKIVDFFDYLQTNDWGFYTDSPQNFPDILLNWKSPYFITNAIIELGKRNNNWKKIVGQLEDLACQSLEVRMFEEISFSQMESFVSLLDSSSIKSLSAYVPYVEHQAKLGWYKNICKKHYRISSLIVYNSPFNEQVFHKNGTAIIFTDQNVNFKTNCGLISDRYFTINMPLFTEAHHHNTCLNRKISIDTEGNIKNCPSMKESYGNIRDTTLQEALEKPGFKKYWNITKDQVEGCKDCEFRYICTDCRAYLEDPENILSKPLKCGYNPHTCKWEEWSTHPLKQKAIKYYGMQELVMSV